MHFPLYIDLSKKNILVVGAGHIAARRIKALLPFTEQIIVVASEAGEDFRSFLEPYCSAPQEAGVYERNAGQFAPGDACSANSFEKTALARIVFKEKQFEEADLEGMDIVLAATDNKELNLSIYELCKAKGIMVNNASDKTLCDFHFPSIVISDNMVIGINASGKDHAGVKRTRIAIEEALEGNRFKQ